MEGRLGSRLSWFYRILLGSVNRIITHLKSYLQLSKMPPRLPRYKECGLNLVKSHELLGQEIVCVLKLEVKSSIEIKVKDNPSLSLWIKSLHHPYD